MPLKTKTWIGLGCALAVVATLVWQFAGQRREEAIAPHAAAKGAFSLRITNAVMMPPASAPVATQYAVIATNPPNAPFTNALAYRLTNTAQPLKQLFRNENAVLLQNALIDTTRGLPEIPEHLRSKGDPGAYIVQARGPISEPFREVIRASGGEIVSYVPNNALLVRASAAAVQKMRASGFPQSVLPFEPYYKLDPKLLALAVKKDLSPYPLVNVVTFPRTTAGAYAGLKAMGAEMVGQPQATTFGDVLTVKAGADQLAAIAQMTEVQMLGVHYEKRAANDLSRVLTRVSTNRAPLDPPLYPPQSHYPAPVPAGRLTGEGVMLAVADTGVDDTHPDLVGRVFWGGLPDFDGHGTHVIGTLLGDGTASPLLSSTNAMGSATNAVFSGMAPRARAFVQNLFDDDNLLQANTALTNARVSNNSWGRPGANDYDIFSADYDAAVRDSLTGVTGEQEVLYVFAAGNDGGGGDNGLNGIPGSVVSPATAKNVITVGASDLPRFISNLVSRACRDVLVGSNTVTICDTNQAWWGMTDTNNQVSPYSARGNVGIGYEGVFGRFKPDVVAPGSMVVSTRGKDYLEPEGSTNTFAFAFNRLNIAQFQTNLFALNVPANAVELTFLVFSNGASPADLSLLIGAGYTPDADSVVQVFDPANGLTLVPNSGPLPLQPGILFYSLANTNHSPSVYFDFVIQLKVTNDVGNYYQVLKEMNRPLFPHYRYEAGTSMAAPAVSGILALMQEYLREQLGITNPSPALLKALLINGARSLSPNYNLQTRTAINHQGWGLVNMSNSVPARLAATNGPTRFFEQSISNSLPTGDAHQYTISVPPQARSFPLRVTLVWTDPPGNPVTGIKLVNDLDLSATADTTNASTSTTSSLLWLGNNFPPGSDFTEEVLMASTDSNLEPVTNLTEVIELNRDIVNNVENIYIRPPLALTYTIVVKGHRVNVNAVNSHLTGHVQDYALVVSSGNVVSNANLNLGATGPVLTNDLDSRRISSMTRAPGATSASLLNQRVGANNPLILSTNGATNQWAFFTYENPSSSNLPYVAILTFFPAELSLPRFREADIDLYVARGPNGTNLFSLDETAIATSTRSLTRLGTELIVFSNAGPGEVFYIGVKSEDQQGANFHIFAASSDRPFSQRDEDGNIIARGVPLPADIPDGSPDKPGGTNVLILVYEPDAMDLTVQRAYVTNSIFHEQAGDIIGTLSHSDPIDQTAAAVVLHNHRSWFGSDTVIYDDSDEGDLGDANSFPPVIKTDGPGKLRDFIGHRAFGVWNYTVSDNALFHTGRVEELVLKIEPASTNDDPVNFVTTIQPGGWAYAGFLVPPDATNVEVCVTEMSRPGPVEIYIRRGALPTLSAYDEYSPTNFAPGGCLNHGLDDTPPLGSGRYFIGVHNPSPDEPITLRIRVRIFRGLLPDRTITQANNDPATITDDATTNSFIFVTNRGIVTAVEVDVRLNHPRISDLALHLVSPLGTRLLLAENRGRDSTNGYGVSISNVVVTNFGARILDSSFEGPSLVGVSASQRYDGWLGETGDIEVLTWEPGRPLNAHSGTNIIDINGGQPGTISTNVILIPGRTYLLSFAYARNPDFAGSSAPRGEVLLSNVFFASNTVQMLVSEPLSPPSWSALKWNPTSVVFSASTATNTLRVRAESWAFQQTGVLFDTFRIDEVEITTNSLLYATFTDNTLKALTPIKFANPPFGDTNFVSTNTFISGFENTNGGYFTNTMFYTNANLFTNGQWYEGWLVTTNSVYVQTNSALAYSETNFLLLRTGAVARTIPVLQGKEYVLTFASRTARRMIYSTGVDQDAIPLQGGEMDTHYILSSNSFSSTTNPFTYVLHTNVPPMGNSWVNRDLPASRWIGPSATGWVTGDSNYSFKTTFDLTGYDWMNTTLRGDFQVDDYSIEVRLNGTNYPNQVVPDNTYSQGAVFTEFTNGFLPRLNTLEVIVHNRDLTTNSSAQGIQFQFAESAIIAPLLSNRVPRVHASVGQVRLAGAYTNYFTALSDNWRVQSVTFVAPSNDVLLEFTGITPGVWLDHIELRETGRKYYQPEEPLTPLVGEPAYGLWQLEVWDSRLGAVLSDSELISWRLNMNFVRTNPPFVRLQNPGSVTRRIGTNSLLYFSFDVPCDEGIVTNHLEVTGPPGYALDLIFNQNTFPLTGAAGDFPLLLNASNDVAYLDVGAAPLLRDGRYFLAVRNTNDVPVDFRLSVSMTEPCVNTPAPSPLITANSFGAGGFKMNWVANPGAAFKVQYASDPAGPWIELPQTITSESGLFSFTDDGTQTGGLSSPRFYRIRQQ